jgi:hypothetical protein
LLIGTANHFTDDAESFLFLGGFLIFMGLAMALRLAMSGKKPIEYDENEPFEVRIGKRFSELDRAFLSSFKWAPRVLFGLAAISLFVSLVYFLAS